MARSSTKKPVPLSPIEQASHVEGGLIGIEPDGIIGWAWNRAAPDRPVTIRLMAAGQLIAEALANRFDDPRVRTLVGSGIPGFATRLAAAPMVAYPVQLSLHDETGAALGAPLPVRAAADLAAVVGPPKPSSYDGNVDGLYDGRLKGWARDAADPSRAIEVELFDTGNPVATVTANELREDLRQAGLHSGLYGFTFDLPVTLLDGRNHNLTVRVAGTPVTLRGATVSFGPLASSALIGQMTALQSEVAGLRQQVNGLIAPDGPVQRQMLRILAERIAAQADIQREQLEREMTALRAMVFAAAERSVGQAPEQYGAKTQAAT